MTTEPSFFSAPTASVTVKLEAAYFATDGRTPETIELEWEAKAPCAPDGDMIEPVSASDLAGLINVLAQVAAMRGTP